MAEKNKCTGVWLFVGILILLSVGIILELRDQRDTWQSRTERVCRIVIDQDVNGLLTEETDCEFLLGQ